MSAGRLNEYFEKIAAEDGEKVEGLNEKSPPGNEMWELSSVSVVKPLPGVEPGPVPSVHKQTDDKGVNYSGEETSRAHSFRSVSAEKSL